MKTKWLIATILSSSLLLPVQQVGAQEDSQDIRFRVLAHSDQEQDQLIKESIYSILQQEIIQTLAGDKMWGRDELIEKMDLHVEEWEKLVQSKLEEQGVTYSATVRFEKHLFPEKVTEDQVYAEGLFDTILVTLGEGKGTNWWCSIFPDLCGQVLIKEAKAETKDKDSECESDLSPEKDLKDKDVKVESFFVSWFQKGWDWITE